MLSVQLECGDCGWRTVCGETAVVRRLRTLGLFRRATDPPAEIVREVLVAHAEQLKCDHCDKIGLIIHLGAEAADRDEWEQVVVCEICRQPIPQERLEFSPNATRCVACQEATDRGESFVEAEYCPKCGSLLELRVSRAGGVTRYKHWCTGNPSCRL